MKALFKKSKWNTLEAADESTIEALKRFKLGEDIELPLVKHRNTRFNAKWRALTRFLFEHQPGYDNYEEFVDALLIACGHYSKVTMPSGAEHLKVKSVSFKQISDDLDFEQKIYKPTMDVAWDKFLINGTPEDRENFENELMRYL